MCLGAIAEGLVADERVERRLAAILAGDVAGYSRLMGADEEGTLRDLKEHRAALDRKSTRLNSSHIQKSRMPSSA